MSKWINIADQIPDEDTEVLTLMKHGMISGFYDRAEGHFRAYYWQDMTWNARYWMPLPEKPAVKKAQPVLVSDPASA